MKSTKAIPPHLTKVDRDNWSAGDKKKYGDQPASEIFIEQRKQDDLRESYRHEIQKIDTEQNEIYEGLDNIDRKSIRALRTPTEEKSKKKLAKLERQAQSFRDRLEQLKVKREEIEKNKSPELKKALAVD